MRGETVPQGVNGPPPHLPISQLKGKVRVLIFSVYGRPGWVVGEKNLTMNILDPFSEVLFTQTTNFFFESHVSARNRNRKL